jgi:hypothetical protein
VYIWAAVSADDGQSVVVCSGCGGKNPPGTNECDWCGRPFLSPGGRIRLTLWQLLSSLLLLAAVVAVAGLAFLNAGRALPPVRVAGAATSTPAPTVMPTAAVTPLVTTAQTPTHPAAAPTPVPTQSEQPPTPEPTPTPQLQPALIANTSGRGAYVHQQPGAASPREGALREGTRVFLTGNDETVAAQPWREIETEDHNLKGWILGDFIQLQAS